MVRDADQWRHAVEHHYKQQGASPRVTYQDVAAPPVPRRRRTSSRRRRLRCCPSFTHSLWACGRVFSCALPIFSPRDASTWPPLSFTSLLCAFRFCLTFPLRALLLPARSTFQLSPRAVPTTDLIRPVLSLSLWGLFLPGLLRHVLGLRFRWRATHDAFFASSALSSIFSSAFPRAFFSFGLIVDRFLSFRVGFFLFPHSVLLNLLCACSVLSSAFPFHPPPLSPTVRATNRRAAPRRGRLLRLRRVEERPTTSASGSSW